MYENSLLSLQGMSRQMCGSHHLLRVMMFSIFVALHGWISVGWTGFILDDLFEYAHVHFVVLPTVRDAGHGGAVFPICADLVFHHYISPRLDRPRHFTILFRSD